MIDNPVPDRAGWLRAMVNIAIDEPGRLGEVCTRVMEVAYADALAYAPAGGHYVLVPSSEAASVDQQRL